MHYTPFSALFKLWAYIKKVSRTYQLLPFVIAIILTQTRLKGLIVQIGFLIFTPVTDVICFPFCQPQTD